MPEFIGRALGAVGAFVAIVTLHIVSFAISGVFILLQIGAAILLLSWLFGWPFEL